MATHAIVVNLRKCLGSGSCTATCQQLGNEPVRMGMVRVDSGENEGKPQIHILHYPSGRCTESAYCMKMFQEKGTTPCAINCLTKAITIRKLEELPALLQDRSSGDAFYFQVLK